MIIILYDVVDSGGYEGDFEQCARLPTSSNLFWSKNTYTGWIMGHLVKLGQLRVNKTK